MKPYRIGYLTPAGADEVKLPYASIVNRRGRVTDGHKRFVQTAMDERAHSMSSRLTSSLIDCEGVDTYPMSGYSYFIVRMKQAGNCSVAVELARYIEWLLSSEQAEVEVENHLMALCLFQTVNPSGEVSATPILLHSSQSSASILE